MSSLMKRKTFTDMCLSLSPKLYSFAYTLISDDLQASQLVVDGLTLFLMKEKEEWLLIEDDELKDKKWEVSYRRDLMKAILGRIYEIGSKRAKHLNVKMMNVDRAESFYKNLEMSARAVSFLKYKWNMSSTEIENILKLSRVEVIEKVHQARFTLMNNSPKLDQISI